MQNQTAQVDENGTLIIRDQPIRNAAVGIEMISSMHLDEWKNSWIQNGDESLLLEAFDEPLVATSCKPTRKTLEVICQYGWTGKIPWDRLFIDEWDRLKGFTEQGFSCVLSRTAQEEVFQAAQDYDDSSFTFFEERIELKTWYDADLAPKKKSFWNDRYEGKDTPWDLGGPAPALREFLPQLKLIRQRVLVLGCGFGWDALLFAEAGHHVTAVDFSADAINQARKNDPHQKVHWVEKNLWDFHGEFDLIFDHTLYCAIPPMDRQKLVKKWSQLLVGNGHLLGIFFSMPKQQGPPFGGSEWELRKRIESLFDPIYWGRLRSLQASRDGKEFLTFLRKKT